MTYVLPADDEGAACWGQKRDDVIQASDARGKIQITLANMARDVPLMENLW